VKMILAEDVAAKAKRRVLVFIFTKGTAACQLMFGRGERSREKGRARGDRYLNLHFVLHVVLHVAHPAQRDLRVVDRAAAVILYIGGGEDETKPLTLIRRRRANAILVIGGIPLAGKGYFRD
jgi:hypothetical protein